MGESASNEWREYISTFFEWVHATTGGRIDINHSALDDFKTSFGDETVPFRYNMITYIFKKA